MEAGIRDEVLMCNGRTVLYLIEVVSREIFLLVNHCYRSRNKKGMADRYCQGNGVDEVI